MLTRGRYGFIANENAAVGIKEKTLQGKIPNIVTRSRAALGDIKNRALDHVKDQNSVKNIKKPAVVPTKHERQCDMSVDEEVDKATVRPDESKELSAFRQHRRTSRMKLLSDAAGSKYIDIDNQDFGDTATVYPYAETIFNYLQNRELAVQPMVMNFMHSQSEVNPRMRYILINWLVQIHHSYKLQPETLYLCVALLDRYLLKHSGELTKDCFQLVGIASLFIAAKFEEMYPPDISDFTAVTHNAFSKADIRGCEQTILQSIDFYLSIPIPLVHLRRFSRAVDADRTMHNLAKYLLELTIQEYDLAYLSGNLRAAVALCLSRALCLQTSNLEEAWSDVLGYLSGHDLDDIRDPLRILAKAAYRQNSPSKYRAIFEKYRLDDFYGRVAALPQLRSCLMETLADLKFDSDGELNQE